MFDIGDCGPPQPHRDQEVKSRTWIM